MTPIREELRRLTALAWPVAATQISTMMLGVVDTLMLGRYDVDALAASALANVWIFGTAQLAIGTIFGLDPIVAQAHGARDGARAGLALQRGIALSVYLSVPISLLWLGTEPFLRAMGQEPALAAAAARYTHVQIPSVPFMLGYFALRQYLQGRELVRPALWVILGANLVNAILDWALIFGRLGAPALGLEGAALATALTRIASLGGLVFWVRVLRLHEGAWVPWTARAWRPGGLREVLSIGVPVGIQTSLEIWAFSGAALLAGRLGATALAAHTIAIQLAALAFMMPLGVSIAAAVRVGNLIGAGRPADAQRAAWVSMGLGAGVMTASAALFVVLRGELPRLFTADPPVLALAAAILPIAGAFQIFDGTQVVGCGVLRGMGRTRPAAIFNLISYWLLAIPLGGWLGLRAGWGLAGVWWGLCIGLALVAALLVVWIHRRGPARLAPAAAPAELGPAL